MSGMINFGIDLGTSNSLIGRFNSGAVEIFKNPISGKESLPSAVCFRKDRIVVGEKARSFAESDPENVVEMFKRKMGTTEVFPIPALRQSKSPVDLSAEVLKELRTFIHTGETPKSVVITIPASFDMKQAIATEQAAHKAGFRQVELLQEPIAASVAYANGERTRDLEGSKWLVYDLGGGTFDVALVKIEGGELTVADHEGDNFLGGTDFDAKIVEELIVPALESLGEFDDLIAEMHSASGRYNVLWRRLLFLAEEGKKELSHSTVSEIDFCIEDDSGNSIDGSMTITRSEFESVIQETVDATAEMIKQLLVRNSMRTDDLEFVLMVGGSTYIPYVRNRIAELLNVDINTGVDPTNAIVTGAAYYAATRQQNLEQANLPEQAKDAAALNVRVAYQRATRDSEELFAARIDGNIDGLFYRITRDDGGYDSGRKTLASRIQEDLPLQEDAFNAFTFRVYDSENNQVAADIPPIQIAHGKYAATGQLLPEDICLVRDNEKIGEQELTPVFLRNTVLPAQKSETYEASVTLQQGTEELIRIIICEGPKDSDPETVPRIGELTIPATGLERNVYAGSDIILQFEMSESRILSVTAELPSVGKSFGDVFKPERNEVNVKTLRDEIESLESRIEREKDEAIELENYELADQLDGTLKSVWQLQENAETVPDDSVTDDRYKLERERLKLAQQVHKMTAGRKLARLRNAYFSTKEEVEPLIREYGHDSEKRRFKSYLDQESAILHTSNLRKLEARISELESLKFGILRRTPEFLMECFEYLCSRTPAFNDRAQATLLIDAGRRAIAEQKWEMLDEAIRRLFSLLPRTDEDDEGQRFRHRVGIR